MNHEVEQSVKPWKDVELGDLLSEAALSIGAGSSTDAGRAFIRPSDHPDLIVLGGGIPDEPTLPVNDLRDTLNHVLETEPGEALQYGGWLGFEGLRAVIAERQSRIEGIDLESDNYIIHNGSSGSVDNICKAFIEPGDVIITEGPSFSGTVRAMRGYRAEIVEAPMDGDGVSVEGVKKAIVKARSSGKRVKFFYTIADYHNPTGATLSEDRREALIKLCAEHQALIVEDAAYTEIYFDEPPPNSIYSIADGWGVLRLGTFSKNIATGLRVGWVQARPDYIGALARVRFDMGNSPLIQRALAEYVASGKLDDHIARMRPVYAEKCEVLCNSLLEHCEPYVRFQKPGGGFFLWVEFVGASAQDVINVASEEGVIFPPGSVFFKERENADTSHARLAFSNASVEQLKEVGPRLRNAFLKVVD